MKTTLAKMTTMIHSMKTTPTKATMTKTAIKNMYIYLFYVLLSTHYDKWSGVPYAVFFLSYFTSSSYVRPTQHKPSQPGSCSHPTPVSQPTTPAVLQYTTPTVLHYTTPAVLHYTTLHYTVLHYTRCTTLHHTRCTTLHHTHCTTLHHKKLDQLSRKQSEPSAASQNDRRTKTRPGPSGRAGPGFIQEYLT